MVRRTVALLWLAAALLFGTTGAHALEPQTIEATCSGCHGPQGVSMVPNFPSIAGQPADFIMYTLKAYQKGVWPAQMMTSFVQGRSEADLRDMAEYYSEQDWVPRPQETEPELVKQGKRIHEALCQKCHRAGGREPADYEPILAGQWMPYLRRALEEYAAGERPMVKGRGKGPKIRQLTEEDIEPLVHFYGSAGAQ